MARIAVGNGIELEVEEQGEGEPLVLVMGIGAQLVHWPAGFCEQLAGRGFRVIRFDNRDAGLSTQLDHAGVPDFKLAGARALLGLSVPAPYTLRDMAGDVVGLLDALGLPRAHVVGISMGGMIAQELALARPDRLATLTSLASSPGPWFVPRPAALGALIGGPPPRCPAEAEERGLRVMRGIGSPHYPLDEAEVRAFSAAVFARASRPQGFARQLVAILATPDRTRALARLRVPTLVLHGGCDPLIPVACGRKTARAIPGAELVVLDKLGHDLPQAEWPALVGAIERHARRVPVTVPA